MAAWKSIWRWRTDAMRRIIICGLVMLIGICCATGCGGAGAGTEEALPPQAGREEAGGAGTEAGGAGTEAGEAGGVGNSADAAREGWKITLTFEGDITLQDSWNGNCQAEGNTLFITNMDYNSKLDAGCSVGGIGFILKIVP